MLKQVCAATDQILVYQLLEDLELAFSCLECGLLSTAILAGKACPHCFLSPEVSLASKSLSAVHYSHELEVGDPVMQEINVLLRPEEARALSQFLKRLDHDALVRYVHSAEHDITEKALAALRQALKDAGHDPR